MKVFLANSKKRVVNMFFLRRVKSQFVIILQQEKAILLSQLGFKLNNSGWAQKN